MNPAQKDSCRKGWTEEPRPLFRSRNWSTRPLEALPALPDLPDILEGQVTEKELSVSQRLIARQRAPQQVVVEAVDEDARSQIRHFPDAHEERSGSRNHERSTQAHDTFSGADVSQARIAGRKND